MHHSLQLNEEAPQRKCDLHCKLGFIIFFQPNTMCSTLFAHVGTHSHGYSVKGQPAEANCVPENSLQRRCLYEAEWSGFPGLEGGHRHRITVVTVTVQLVGGQ
ncbi:hypothetical protein AMECASPLE_035387 [Ameca splendens]|uniref:Uncharacterized protein n=1 Tax=Ameca splendens TaxID=208324 RepID=A0ABV0YJH3_9TELE